MYYDTVEKKKISWACDSQKKTFFQAYNQKPIHKKHLRMVEPEV